MFKNFITKRLQSQAKRYIAKHQPKIIAVAGSIGKTSTKIAIATVLSQRYKVRVHSGNYNVDVTVPLVVFDIDLPKNLHSPFAWFGILIRAEAMIHTNKDQVDVIILELGTDKPGDIEEFKSWLTPDISVVTAVVPEHMEFFKTLDAVAQEELAVASFSKLTIINRDDVAEEYARYATTENIDTYGLSGVAEYRFVIEDAKPGQGFSGKFISPEFGEMPMQLQVVGEHNVKFVVAAGAVGAKLGLSGQQVAAGMQAFEPVAGRMNLLKGLKRSTIIDDTYNSSPVAAIAALQTLYKFPAPQHIAVLGNMNELGDFSPQAHEQVGKACDPKVLDWVVAVGEDAEKYLAPTAASKGCQVRSFKNAIEAGTFVHEIMQPEAIILVKGSQGDMYLEEAVKILLHDENDASKLVRQTDSWLTRKNKFFSAFK